MAMTAKLRDQERRDQESREHEEQRHAGETTFDGEACQARVRDEHDQDRDAAEPVQLGSVAHHILLGQRDTSLSDAGPRPAGCLVRPCGPAPTPAGTA